MPASRYIHNSCGLLTHVSTLAVIIWDSGAASIRDCQVFVEFGITKPNSKDHSVGRRKMDQWASQIESQGSLSLSFRVSLFFILRTTNEISQVRGVKKDSLRLSSEPHQRPSPYALESKALGPEGEYNINKVFLEVRLDVNRSIEQKYRPFHLEC